MMFSVPQFIDVEDKIAGPLTWRQLLWMIAMGAILLTVFAIFDKSLAFVFSIPTVLLFCALAFYRPNGFSLISYIASAFIFLFRPKVAVWERPVTLLPPERSATQTPAKATAPVTEKGLTREKLAELARIIDSRGRK